MSPERAFQRLQTLGFKADDFIIRSHADKYGGDWVVFAPFGDELRPVTQDASLRKLLCIWMPRYRALEEGK